MKYTKEKLKEIVPKCKTYADVLRAFGSKQSGGNHSHLSRTIKKFEISTDHFLGRSWNKGNLNAHKKSFEDILVLRSNKKRANSTILRRALIESGVQYRCSCCGLNTWMGKAITLDIDHINEDWQDDRQENLRFLCPNCHRNSHREVAELADAAGLDPADLNRHLGVRLPSSLLINECLDCGKKCHKDAKRCKSCSGVVNNKDRSKRPTKEQLSEDISSLNSLCAVGRKYGVSDNAVRKWLKFYEQ